MSRKHLGMKRPIRQFERAFGNMIEYINAFALLPPRGEYAKAQAIKEWKDCINDVIIQINNIKNTQIELLERDD